MHIKHDITCPKQYRFLTAAVYSDGISGINEDRKGTVLTIEQKLEICNLRATESRTLLFPNSMVLEDQQSWAHKLTKSLTNTNRSGAEIAMLDMNCTS